MEQKTSSFDRVLGAWDILVIAFGAMIGWGWVVSTGTWIQDGGVLGAAIGFLIGGVMIFFVGLTYAELTSAMPQCGGEHVFSHRAMGPIGSFICTWAIVLGYASVVCFEACALPTIVTYIFPDFLQGYLYTVAGFKVYASWLAVAIGMSILMTYINIRGVKAAAKLQTALTLIIGAAGILLVVVSALTGSVSTLEPQAFLPGDSTTTLKAVLAVAVTTPFYFIGFDVIPQAAEEINVPLKKIGKILILSVVCAVLFYALVIIAVGLVLTGSEILAAESGTGLVTADAMAKALSSATMAKVIIIGGTWAAAAPSTPWRNPTWCRASSRSSIRNTRRPSTRSTSSASSPSSRRSPAARCSSGSSMPATSAAASPTAWSPSPSSS